jgi:hypothetical protein
MRNARIEGMEKIYTIFDRDWEGNRKVVDKVINNLPEGAVATEKVDGTNVRLTVRNHILVRVEKRVNPSPVQKVKGIVDPWYMDADEYSPADKYIYEAVRSTDLTEVEDGEWSGEAIGEKIQGNPLKIISHKVILFSVAKVRETLAIPDAPTSYKEVKEWLPKQKSKINKEVGIEGVVWWKENEPVGKIKLKDF